MTVKDLIVKLQSQDENLSVVLQDAEWGDYYLVHELETKEVSFSYSKDLLVRTKVVHLY